MCLCVVIISALEKRCKERFMRVALCLFGLVGSVTGKNGIGERLDPTIVANLLKKNLIDANPEVEFDFFIHSWSYETESQLQELYAPKKAVIEVQKDFPQARKHKNLLFGLKAKLKNFYQKLFDIEQHILWTKETMMVAERAYSRWYSSKAVIELKKEYEEDNGFKYDCVFVSRLDVGFYRPVYLTKYDFCNFYVSNWNNLPRKGENEYQVCGSLNHVGKSFYDMWFFSNSSNMDKFGSLYDHIHRYYINPHVASWQHVKRVIGKDNVRYTLFRWYDHEMVRVREFGNFTKDDLKYLNGTLPDPPEQ